MIFGGKGGANTGTGRVFEGERDFLRILERSPGYTIKRSPPQPSEIYFDGQLVAKSVRQHAFYRFLKGKGIDWRPLVSKRLLPDEAIYVPDRSLMSIVELKFQRVAGSVDEKLQTCAFKLGRYRHLLSESGIEVRYSYLLGDWFKKPEYRDVLSYIEKSGCRYYFDDLPLADLGLPEREAEIA